LEIRAGVGFQIRARLVREVNRRQQPALDRALQVEQIA
jgi:hypothetical protein